MEENIFNFTIEDLETAVSLHHRYRKRLRSQALLEQTSGRPSGKFQLLPCVLEVIKTI